jgi:hypothetical protein
MNHSAEPRVAQITRGEKLFKAPSQISYSKALRVALNYLCSDIDRAHELRKDPETVAGLGIFLGTLFQSRYCKIAVTSEFQQLVLLGATTLKRLCIQLPPGTWVVSQRYS